MEKDEVDREGMHRCQGPIVVDGRPAHEATNSGAWASAPRDNRAARSGRLRWRSLVAPVRSAGGRRAQGKATP